MDCFISNGNDFFHINNFSSYDGKNNYNNIFTIEKRLVSAIDSGSYKMFINKLIPIYFMDGTNSS